jgi:hypothetical protein
MLLARERNANIALQAAIAQKDVKAVNVILKHTQVTALDDNIKQGLLSLTRDSGDDELICATSPLRRQRLQQQAAPRVSKRQARVVAHVNKRQK